VACDVAVTSGSRPTMVERSPRASFMHRFAALVNPDRLHSGHDYFNLPKLIIILLKFVKNNNASGCDLY
jgi:hypothetical protein